MDIDEVKAKKTVLENKIHQLLTDFTNETDVTVSFLRLIGTKVYTRGRGYVTTVYHVETSLEL